MNFEIDRESRSKAEYCVFRIISDSDKIGSRTGEVSNAIYSRFTGRQKEGSDEAIPCILEPQGDEKIFRRNWARWIQKIGACPGEGRESRSLDLPEMSGHYAGH